MDGIRLAADSTDVAGEAHPDTYPQTLFQKAHQCLQETLVKEGPTRVLLVEDNPGDVLLTKEAVAEVGIRNNIHVAKDREDALAFLRRENGFADAVRPGDLSTFIDLVRAIEDFWFTAVALLDEEASKKH